MIHKLCILIFFSGFVFVICAGKKAEDYKGKDISVFWNKEQLFKTPAVQEADYPDSKVNGLRSVVYDSLPFKGKPEKVFAYIGFPQGKAPKDGFPTVVLVHGGGGTAFAQYVKVWNKRGYAAIAMDHYGQRPSNKNPRKHLPLDGGCKKQWTTRAPARIVLAHSLIRSFPQVNKNKVMLIGISWGGVYACIVSAIDNRFNALLAVYGCGFFETDDKDLAFSKRTMEKTPWDPGYFLPKASAPLFWLDGTNDYFFGLKALQNSIDAAPASQNRCLIVKLFHGHEAFGYDATFRIVDSVLKNAGPLPKLGRITIEGTMASVKILNQGKGIVKGEFHYTSDSKRHSKRNWTTLPATVKDAMVSAEVPPAALEYYFSVSDEKDTKEKKYPFSAASNVIFIEK